MEHYRRTRSSLTFTFVREALALPIRSQAVTLLRHRLVNRNWEIINDEFKNKAYRGEASYHFSMTPQDYAAYLATMPDEDERVVESEDPPSPTSRLMYELFDAPLTPEPSPEPADPGSLSEIFRASATPHPTDAGDADDRSTFHPPADIDMEPGSPASITTSELLLSDQDFEIDPNLQRRLGLSMGLRRKLPRVKLFRDDDSDMDEVDEIESSSPGTPPQTAISAPHPIPVTPLRLAQGSEVDGLDSEAPARRPFARVRSQTSIDLENCMSSPLASPPGPDDSFQSSSVPSLGSPFAFTTPTHSSGSGGPVTPPSPTEEIFDIKARVYVNGVEELSPATPDPLFQNILNFTGFSEFRAFRRPVFHDSPIAPPRPSSPAGSDFASGSAAIRPPSPMRDLDQSPPAAVRHSSPTVSDFECGNPVPRRRYFTYSRADRRRWLKEQTERDAVEAALLTVDTAELIDQDMDDVEEESEDESMEDEADSDSGSDMAISDSDMAVLPVEAVFVPYDDLLNPLGLPRPLVDSQTRVLGLLSHGPRGLFELWADTIVDAGRGCNRLSYHGDFGHLGHLSPYTPFGIWHGVPGVKPFELLKPKKRVRAIQNGETAANGASSSAQPAQTDASNAPESAQTASSNLTEPAANTAAMPTQPGASNAAAPPVTQEDNSSPDVGIHQIALGGPGIVEAQQVLSSPSFKLMSDFQNHMFQRCAPMAYAHAEAKINQLVATGIVLPAFPGSVFTTTHLDFACKDSVPQLNRDAALGSMEAITFLGKYTGGRVKLNEDGTEFEAPPGTTIVFLSRTQSFTLSPLAKNERRYLFRQFCSAGVHRWVEKGGHTDAEFTTVASLEEHAQWLKKTLDRGTDTLKLISKLDDLFVV
ncbi:hypothetical protein R3P38DRAFT_3347620 [Favolaschia claudopus]|uniref:Uncharacterized protein n=1 Tax=Favolaschia claudopus TaxID=2862362 RepID=A0AAW0CXQ7_9AGAR